MNKYIDNRVFSGERARFMSRDTHFYNCDFENGESPLKESNNISLDTVEFRWKYPLWYCNHVKCHNVKFLETARSGVWYTNDIEFVECNIEAPKTFRRCDGVRLINVKLPNAKETFWGCKNISINKVHAVGDYFGFNSIGIDVNYLTLDGNYGFDGGKDIIVRCSTINSKDCFWNCENVTVIDSTIIGEYLGWYSKNVTFVNCKIISHQGLCYMENVKLVNCQIIGSDLIFEFCKDIDAEVKTEIDSVINPTSGVIKAKGIKKLIIDEKQVDPKATRIEKYEE